jgi:hypothetical protein
MRVSISINENTHEKIFTKTENERLGIGFADPPAGGFHAIFKNQILFA